MLGAAAKTAIPEADIAVTPTHGMSPRQLRLNTLHRYFRCETYDDYRIDWDGKEVVGVLDHEYISAAGFLPSGFYDAGQHLPLKFRKPTAPYHLVRLIVNRFTSLLFGADKHPDPTIPGDDDNDAMLGAIIEAGHFWAKMILTRNKGGSTGTGAIGYKIVRGVPTFEVFDARHTTPKFVDPDTHELAELEVRYVFIEDVRDEETGGWKKRAFWYRRLLTANTDAVWPRVPVGDGTEPAWNVHKCEEVAHMLGEVPAVWIQNLPVDGQVDGDPDCHGIYETVREVDALVAQAHRGIKATCTPVTVVSTDADLDVLNLDVDNALKLDAAGSADYLEATGKGPDAAFTAADRAEDRACRMARVVLEEHRKTVAKTATEVDRDYSSMWEQLNIFREQYGEHGVKPLLIKAMRITRKVLEGVVIGDDGVRVRQMLALPPRQVKQADGSVIETQHRFGKPDITIELKWPPYVRPTLDDVSKAVGASKTGLDSGVIDLDIAVAFLAPYFQIEDPAAVVTRIRAAAKAVIDAEREDAYAQMAGSRTSGSPDGKKYAEIYGYHITEGVVTLRESRAAVGIFERIADDDLTLPQYKAKHPEYFAAAANADDGSPTGAPIDKATEQPVPGAPKKGKSPALSLIKSGG